MESHKYFIYIYTLILIIFPNIMDTQRITCPNACDIGYTCAMVRHGRGPSSPGCITMQEAILLNEALNGGASGPGSGIRNPTGTGFPQSNVRPDFPQSPRPGDPIPPFPASPGPQNSIPGMNFLGGTAPQQQGFEQRFEEGLGRQPNMLGQQGSFGMSGRADPFNGRFEEGLGRQPNMLGQQGNFGMSGRADPFNGRTPQRPAGMPRLSFMDPTAGQPGQFGPAAGQFGPTAGQFGPAAGQFGPAAGQFGPTAGQFGPSAGQFGPINSGNSPIGFNPQVDGGHSHISSASGNRDNTNIGRHDHTRGDGRIHRSDSFPGELSTPDINLDPQFNSNPETLNENALNNIPDGFIGTGSAQRPRVDTFINTQQDMNAPEQFTVDVPVPSQQPPVVKPTVVSEPHSNVHNEHNVDLDGAQTHSLATETVEQSRVTSIREDSSGLHYVFYPGGGSAGFRVDITKDGFCPRATLTRDNACSNECYSDSECDFEQKCCPVGCSLRCRIPAIPAQNINSRSQGNQPSK